MDSGENEDSGNHIYTHSIFSIILIGYFGSISIRFEENLGPLI